MSPDPSRHSRATPAAVSSAPVPSLRALSLAGSAWLGAVVVGQLVFAAYVTAFYGGSAVLGEFERWNKLLGRGLRSGEDFGNALLVAHLLLTVVVSVAGAIQLLAVVRRRWPALHRSSGRVFLSGAVVLAVSGLVLLVMGGGAGDASQKIGSALNALAILLCAAAAWRHARARRIGLHQRWALRLFLVVGGVFFFRIGLSLWLLVHQAPVGFDPETFSGPILTVLAFAQWLLPLALLQLYWRAQAGPLAACWAMTALAAVLTLMTAAAVGAAALVLWLPVLGQLAA